MSLYRFVLSAGGPHKFVTLSGEDSIKKFISCIQFEKHITMASSPLMITLNGSTFYFEKVENILLKDFN